MPCASSRPGATASMNRRTLWPERRTIHAPTRQPSRIPPQTPRPPCQTAKGPHHSSGTSSQLVTSWYARAPTMPAATPQTATRKTRSQSPPQRTQRQPVRATQAAIASSSISPYMWIVNGPASIVPLEGDGMLARKVTGQEILPGRAASCPRNADQWRGSGGTGRFPQRQTRRQNGAKNGLEQDLQCQLCGAAATEQADRKVQVDVLPQSQLGRRLGAVAGHLELLGPPGLHQLGLVPDFRLYRSHLHGSVFGRSARPVVPLPGDISGELEHLILVQVTLQPEGGVAGEPDQDVAGQPGLDRARLAGAELPPEHVLAALEPERELPEVDALHLRPRVDDLLRDADLLAPQLGEQHGLPPVVEERRDQPRLRVVARRRRAREVGQRHPQLGAALGDRTRERRPEAGRQRPLLGARQRLDAFDGDGADVEEAQDRGARLRHGHRDPERHERECYREHEHPARRHDLEAPPPLETRTHDRQEIRLGREVELASERDECAFELSHTLPSAARAHARCATSRSPAGGRAPPRPRARRAPRSSGARSRCAARPAARSRRRVGPAAARTRGTLPRGTGPRPPRAAPSPPAAPDARGGPPSGDDSSPRWRRSATARDETALPPGSGRARATP